MTASHSGADPWRVLGLGPDAGPDEIHAARRRLAKRHHPDVGGSDAEMGRVNAAVAAALASIGSRPAPRRRSPGATTHDHPSFTIEALPAEAFEALLLVATELGDVIDDDPPYRLEVALGPASGIRGWCELQLVPEAGASTVSLAIGAEPGWPVPDLDDVRDRWIDHLNQLDWPA